MNPDPLDPDYIEHLGQLAKRGKEMIQEYESPFPTTEDSYERIREQMGSADNVYDRLVEEFNRDVTNPSTLGYLGLNEPVPVKEYMSRLAKLSNDNLFIRHGFSDDSAETLEKRARGLSFYTENILGESDSEGSTMSDENQAEARDEMLDHAEGLWNGIYELMSKI